eukprot:1147792-Pelagomonas_calceolata.AAC.2
MGRSGEVSQERTPDWSRHPTPQKRLPPRRDASCSDGDDEPVEEPEGLSLGEYVGFLTLQSMVAYHTYPHTRTPPHPQPPPLTPTHTCARIRALCCRGGKLTAAGPPGTINRGQRHPGQQRCRGPAF